jgi:hypothetical protein
VAAPVAPPVGEQVVRDPVEPGRERRAALVEIRHVRERPVENARRQVFGLAGVAGAVKDVGVDAIDIALVEHGERFGLGFGPLDQLRLGFVCRSSRHRRRRRLGLHLETPRALNSRVRTRGEYFIIKECGLPSRQGARIKEDGLVLR